MNNEEEKTDGLVEDFQKACAPIIKFLRDNKAPHPMVVITPDAAHLLDGRVGLLNFDMNQGDS